MRPRTLALLLLAALSAAALATFLTREHTAKPAAPAPDDEYVLWLPPGEYSSIVIATTATDRTWWVSLQDSRGLYPVTLPERETTTLRFDGNLTVTPATKTRLVSRFVPWGDYAEFHPLQGGNIRLFAWGVTATGDPVNFIPDSDNRRK